MKKTSLALSLILVLTACKTSEPKPTATPQKAEVSAASRPTRASDARARLNASESGKIVLRATDIHGGLERWFAQEAIHFRYDYVPLMGMRRNSSQTIDVHNARAYHDLEGFGAFAWDGEEAFKEFSQDFPVRFWALTPFYFVGLPFVLSDAGVNLERVDDPPEDVGLPPADVVKATFNDVGDAPDDYYILYFAKDDGRLMATRYIVTYSAFYQDDPTRKPKEKILYFEEFAAHDGIVLAGRHDFFMMKGKTRGEKVTVSTLSEVEVDVPFDESRMGKSESAIVDSID